MIHLEHPINLYMLDKLEFLFLHLEGVEAGWRTDDKCPAHVQEVVTTKTRIPNSIDLMEGRCWLLDISDTGSVTYFDLDASPITEKILIPNQFPSIKSAMWDQVVHMAVDVDRNLDFLTFNLALSFFTLTHPMQHSVQIWKVILLHHDQQHRVGLTAECLASFPQEPLVCCIDSLSLCGPHIALSVFGEGLEYPRCIFIINWLQANGVRHGLCFE